MEAKITYTGDWPEEDSAECPQESGACQPGCTPYVSGWSAGTGKAQDWQLYVQDMETVTDTNWLGNSGDDTGISYGNVISGFLQNSGGTELEYDTGASSGTRIVLSTSDMSAPHGLKTWYGIPGKSLGGTANNRCVTTGTDVATKTIKITADSSNVEGLTALYHSEDGAQLKVCYLEAGEYIEFELTANAEMTERNRSICECGNFVCQTGTDNAGENKASGDPVVLVGTTNDSYGQNGDFPLCDPSEGPKGDSVAVLCGNLVDTYAPEYTEVFASPAPTPS